MKKNIEAGPAELLVGVTGHRVLTEPGRIRSAVDTALNQITQSYPERTITVLSSLAEGADRLVVREVLARLGAKLIVVLPMPKSEFMQDFANEESREEFLYLLDRATSVIELNPLPTRNQTYSAAGEYVLDHCAVLLAVWDGEMEQGEGGTAAIVAGGRTRALPLAWIHAGNRVPGTNEPTSLGAEQGLVTFERLRSESIVCASPAISDPRHLIAEARERHDSRALKLQKKRLTFALVAVAIGPVAVSLLAVQVIAVPPEFHFVARVLIGLELILLAGALGISFMSTGRSHNEWIRERLRSEILRREEFLLYGQVGPYLNTPRSMLDNRVQERLRIIENDVGDPLPLLSMTDSQGIWSEALEDAKTSGNLLVLPDLADRVRIYVSQRVAIQREWFAAKSKSHELHSRILENGAKLILTLALIVAAYHLGSIAVAAPSQGDGNGHDASSHKALMIIAICLPAVGGTFVGLQSILGSERLSRSYRYHAEALLIAETSLRRLQTDMASASPATSAETQFRFMRGVLATEELLTDELQKWWLVMYPTAPRPGG
jgi:hypothetical protein